MALQTEKKLAGKQHHKNSKTLMVSFMLYLTGMCLSELRKACSRMDIVTTLTGKLNIQNKYQQKSASSLTNLNRDL